MDILTPSPGCPLGVLPCHSKQAKLTKWKDISNGNMRPNKTPKGSPWKHSLPSLFRFRRQELRKRPEMSLSKF